uniref:Transmembrane protein n=1 Tax=Knipowitschia caucasica TaxID=637954 RepID=A0AAV2M8W7_KNICA
MEGDARGWGGGGGGGGWGGGAGGGVLEPIIPQSHNVTTTRGVPVPASKWRCMVGGGGGLVGVGMCCGSFILFVVGCWWGGGGWVGGGWVVWGVVGLCEVYLCIVLWGWVYMM